MADIQDKINEILSNPEALRQVQSLGEQLGLAGNAPEKPQPPEKKNELSLPTDFMNDDIAKSLIKILPAVKSIGCEDDTTRLLNALRPFLSCVFHKIKTGAEHLKALLYRPHSRLI